MRELASYPDDEIDQLPAGQITDELMLQLLLRYHIPPSSGPNLLSLQRISEDKPAAWLVLDYFIQRFSDADQFVRYTLEHDHDRTIIDIYLIRDQVSIEHRRRASSRFPALAICRALLKFMAALERTEA